jgi:hypothetical protein
MSVPNFLELLYNVSTSQQSPFTELQPVSADGEANHCTPALTHCTALHCTPLHCPALHCTALHCTGHLHPHTARTIAAQYYWALVITIVSLANRGCHNIIVWSIVSQ